MITRSAFNIKRTSFSCRTIGIEWVAIRFLIILITRESTPAAQPDDASTGPDTLTARRAVSIKRARDSLRAEDSQYQRRETKLGTDALHELPPVRLTKEFHRTFHALGDASVALV
jgi:hypothetical protein